MDTGITCITLSKEPFVRTDIPGGFEYVNYVSDFKNSMAALHDSWLNAVMLVRTKGFIFVDSDDPFPVNVRLPKDKAILIGDEIILRFLHNKSFYTEEDYINNPTAIHKAVCLTSPVHRLLPFIPKGTYLTEWMIYSCLIKLGGFEYDNSFVYTWNKQLGKGMHTKASCTGSLTKNWIKTEMPKVLEMLTSSD